MCGEQRLTYAEFEAIVGRCAAGLTEAGIGSGDRVAMLLGNGLAFPIVMFAAFRVGAIAVPLNIREQSDGLRYMLQQCGAKLIVFDNDLRDRLPAAPDVPSLLTRVAVDRSAPIGNLQLLSHSNSAPPAEVV